MLDRHVFFSEYYEVKPCLMKKSINSGLISWQSIDEALYVGENYSSGARLHKDGSYVPDELYVEPCSEIGAPKRKINKGKFRKIIAEGGSIVFNRMESVSWRIREINNAISSYVGEDTCANGYISFGGEDALSCHWDTHDVFATQLIGKKLWKIYGVTQPLPLASNKSINHKNECPATPMMELILEEGDILYLPRGWWHSAHPLPKTDTFHLAVGVHPTMPEHYLSWLMNTVMHDAVSYRQSIRLNDKKIELEGLAHAVSQAILSNENFSNFVQRRRDSIRVFSDFNIERLAHKKTSSEMAEIKYRLNSKLIHEHQIQSGTINGVRIPKEDSVLWRIVETLSNTTDVLSFTEIANRLPHLSAEDVISNIEILATKDVIGTCVDFVLREN